MTKNSIHITFALASFFPKYRAGTETYVLNLVHFLKKLGYKISIITPDTTCEIGHYTYEGFIVHTYKIPKKVSASEMNGLKKPSGLNDFLEIVRKIQPDIVHFHSFNRAIDSRHLTAVKDMGIKTVFTAHLGSIFCVRGDLRLMGKKPCSGEIHLSRCSSCWLTSKGLPSPLGFVLSKLLFTFNTYKLLVKRWPMLALIPFRKQELLTLSQKADAVIAIAPWIQKSFQRNKVNNTKLVKQGIDATIYREDFTYKLYDPLRFIFVGRMHPTKGVHVLMDSLQKLSDTERKYISLKIVTIPFKQEHDFYVRMKNQYFELGFNDWQENLSATKVKNQMKSSNLLILPSVSGEAAPLVILEANSLKVPVLGSDHIAIKDMILDNHDGVLFRNEDAASLVKIIRKIIGNPQKLRRWSTNIKSVRDVSDIGNEMHDIYAQVLSK